MGLKLPKLSASLAGEGEEDSSPAASDTVIRSITVKIALDKSSSRYT